MAHASDPRLVVAHVLQLTGLAEVADVVARTGLDGSEVADRLADLAADGLAVRRCGARPGWSPTPEGRRRHALELREELVAARARPVVADLYRRFRALNDELLGLCTAWQVRDVAGRLERNDHTDAGYDAAVLDRLAAVDAGIHPLLAELGGVLSRFGGYGPRLRRARRRVEGGDGDWLTRPTLDSYHSVWFELHEDLLRTLGIERGQEGEARRGG